MYFQDMQDEGEVEKYLTNMEGNEWADEHVIAATANLLQISIVIIQFVTGRKDESPIPYVYNKQEKNANGTIHVVNVGNFHFFAAVPTTKSIINITSKQK